MKLSLGYLNKYTILIRAVDVYSYSNVRTFFIFYSVLTDRSGAIITQVSEMFFGRGSNIKNIILKFGLFNQHNFC